MQKDKRRVQGLRRPWPIAAIPLRGRPEPDENRRLPGFSGKLLRHRPAGHARDGKQPVGVEAVAGLGRQAGHGGTDEVGHAVGSFRMSRGNEGADNRLGMGLRGAGGVARTRIVAARPLDHEAASGNRICDILPGCRFQNRRQAFRHRLVRPQEIGKRNSAGRCVAIKHAGVKPRLAAKGGVETRRIDAQRLGHIGHTHGIVATGMKQLLRGCDPFIGIEPARAAAGSGRIFCITHYINLDADVSPIYVALVTLIHKDVHMTTFKGKSVLVLGGSRGIGAAIVRRFAADGATVTFTYAGSQGAAEQLAAETGSTAVFTDSADRDQVISRVRDSGPLNILVVNAGIAFFGDALEQDPDAVDRLFRINIQAPYHASVEAARQMPEGGRIIVIGSVNGDRMPVPGMASYAVSKSALQGLARGLARDFGPRGITINVVQPGPVDTDANPENGPMRELMHSFMAIKRHGRPEEVAGMVAWLAGPEAGFVTGAMHTIDGAFGA